MLDQNDQPADLYNEILCALQAPLTARALTAYLYDAAWTGRDLWRVIGYIDRIVSHGQIVRCGHRDGRPVYVA